jgi:hypothetical protein
MVQIPLEPKSLFFQHIELYRCISNFLFEWCIRFLENCSEGVNIHAAISIFNHLFPELLPNTSVKAIATWLWKIWVGKRKHKTLLFSTTNSSAFVIN